MKRRTIIRKAIGWLILAIVVAIWQLAMYQLAGMTVLVTVDTVLGILLVIAGICIFAGNLIASKDKPV